MPARVTSSLSTRVRGFAAALRGLDCLDLGCLDFGVLDAMVPRRLLAQLFLHRQST
jgi:hypothetical protein